MRDRERGQKAKDARENYLIRQKYILQLLNKCITQQESFRSENMVIKTGETQWLHSTVLASLFE